MFTKHANGGSETSLSKSLDKAIGIICSSRSSMPALFYAVSTEDENSVYDILNTHEEEGGDFDINAKVDGKKQKQYTVLHVAAKLTTNANIIKLLLNSGRNPDVNTKDKRGYTPLDWCFERMMDYPDSTSHNELLVLRSIFLELLAHKADINSKDCAGKTMIDKAGECSWSKQDKGFDPENCMISFLAQNGIE